MDQSFYKPLGQVANYNFGRFQSPEATAALKDYAAATSDAQRTKDHGKFYPSFFNNISKERAQKNPFT